MDPQDRIEVAQSMRDRISAVLFGKDDEAILCLLLDDARNFRNPACRITKKRSFVRKWYNKPLARLILTLVCIVLLLLPFMEHRDSFSATSLYDWRNETVAESYKNYFPIAIPIEGFCLLIVTVSCIIRCCLVFTYDRALFCKLFWTSRLSSFYRSEFFLMIICIVSLTIYWIFWLTSIIHYAILEYTSTERKFLLIRQLIRPLFLIAHVHLMRKVIKAIFLAFIPVLRVIGLFVSIIFLFALIGVIIFEDNDEYFGSIPKAMWSLLIYTTASNSPDILISSYADSRFSFVYFQVFFLLSNIFNLNILTLLLAIEFMLFIKASVERSYKCRFINLLNVFERLKSNGKKLNDLNELLTKAGIKSLGIDNDARIRDNPPIDDQFWPEFKKFCNNQFQAYSSLTDSVIEKKWIVNFGVAVNITGAVVAFAHAVVITIFIVEKNEKALNTTTIFFSVIFPIELILKTVLTICYMFFSETRRQALNSCASFFDAIVDKCLVIAATGLDMCALLAVFIMGIVSLILSDNDQQMKLVQWTNVLVLLRFMLLVITSRFFSDVVHTLLHALYLLLPMGLLGYLLYYLFAVVGIFLFHEKVDLLDSSAAECGNFKDLEYFSFNFQDFASSQVTLWNLMLVSNWFIIVEYFVEKTSIEYGIFFVIWWFMIETVLSAILFGALLYIIEKAISEFKKDRKGWKSILKDAVGLDSKRENNSFKSLIKSWTIYYVKDLDDFKIDDVTEELDNNKEEFTHPDLVQT